MAMPPFRPPTGTALCLLMSLPVFAGAALAQDGAPTETVVLDTVVISAEEQAKQALGTSTVTAEDLEKSPVINDVSEIIRKMPGVNLTGATATGQRGNQRQIDIRGMGPENTLILIDGKPALSRNSVRMSRGGERDTRGDSNWVPAEMIDRIEVIRGPAAARYGSGASGGVVNIITKRPEAFSGQVGLHYNQPESSKEGAGYRTNFMLGGPIGETLSFRLFGNYNKTRQDAWDINPETIVGEGDDAYPRRLAGREGVVNKDLGALLSWQLAPGHVLDLEASYSRQGNLYAGDTGFGDVNEDTMLDGAETNRMYRRAVSLTHRGDYDFGESVSYLQWEHTLNSRLCEGLAGGGEGTAFPCVDTDGDGENDAYEFRDITLDNITAKSEWILPVTVAGRSGKATLGAEYRGEFMDDPVSIRNGLPPGVDPGVPEDWQNRDPKTKQNQLGLYAEANIEWNDRLTLTPGLRFDYSNVFGNNWSPSLNATYAFDDAWTMKLGLARAFKAPNLYQLNPNYVYVTRGFGCPVIGGIKVSGPCYVLGNPDLEPERSLNKEIGVSYQGANQLNGSLTYFHNDYDNRIGSGFIQYNSGAVENRLFRWENQGEAVISGLEGNISTPLGPNFAFNANFTKMIKSESKETGDPLSLVPDYTVNASVDWYASDAVTVTLSATRYGEIETAKLASTTGESLGETEKASPYTLVNLGANWQVNDRVRLSGGVTNLQDRRILRTNTSEGTATFNEAGRAFYLSLTSNF